MNLVIKENQFNISNVYYTEPIQNIVMDNSKFIKLIYSTENVMISGVCLLLQLKVFNPPPHQKPIFSAKNLNLKLRNTSLTIFFMWLFDS